ncbi:MAG: DUF937 domain-containing protein [Erysipelotrichaceae bacterium]|nr:DUF937 domain-containing protein [Erysipelotrichaceae bacterium]
MNLLQLLLGTLVSQKTVNTVSKKTGANSNLTSKLLLVAIPLLIKYMTSNAKKQNGAQSLLNALGQHTNTNTMADQIRNADENDGEKIIQHILGNDKNKVVNSLASETGLTNNQVNQTLSNIAPALLSGLSAATTATNKKKNNGVDLSDGLDMSDLVGLFGGSGGNSAGGLLGSLLGGGQQQQQQSSGMGDILGALLGTPATSNKKPAANSGADLTGLLSSLLGAQTQTTSKKKTTSRLDGTDLINLLTALSK